MSSISPIKSQGPGRPKDMEKRAAILDAAKALFVRNAFAGTSMDAVAAEAGVSKLTVYSHFGDKDNLFREVMRARIQDLLPEQTYDFDPEGRHRRDLAQDRADPCAGRLRKGNGRHLPGDPQRLSPGQSALWPAVLGRGSTRTHALMERLLTQAVEAGMLEIDDIPRTTRAVLRPDQGQPDDATDVRLRRLPGGLRR